MTKNKWQLHRAGLLNFWYYDEEEFDLTDGKLLLRGGNGSGKSVTMQSFIPVLLDGRKSPDRLDPFGSRARKMEDYLLGEKEIVDRDERTGYLYLEYKRRDTDQYLTTGIGLRAKRQSNLDFWGFVILDNRRIGRDYFFYNTEYNVETGQQEKIPLSRIQLENALQEGGKVVRSQKEYMELVNKHIFGFESLEAYEELIKLLIQLRSPKLSKDFKPTVIYEILNESLPGLSDEELRPLSDTIESMDQTKQQLDLLLRDQQSLKRLCQQYDRYNQFVLAEKAEGLIAAHKEQEELVRQGKELEEKLQGYQGNLITLAAQMKQLEEEQIVKKEEEKSLREHSVFKAEEERQRILGHIKDTEETKNKKRGILDTKQSKERELDGKLRVEGDKVAQYEAEIQDLADLLDDAGGESYFPGHEIAIGEFRRKFGEDFSFYLWKEEVNEYQKKIEQILRNFQEEINTKEKYQEGDHELGEARKQLDQTRFEAKKWAQLFEEEKDRLLNLFHQWLKENQELRLSQEEIQLISQRIMQIYQQYRFEEVLVPLRQAQERYQNQLNYQIMGQKSQIKDKDEAILHKQEEVEAWKKIKEPEPPRHSDTEKERRALKENGIPFVPFFSSVEFQDHIAPEHRERIEAAITQMGLLDALVVSGKQSHLTGQFDRVIQPQPHLFAHTLADFLYPTPVEGSGVAASDIDQVLRSVLIDDQGDKSTMLREDGTYRIDLLKGHAPKTEGSIYIGREARRSYRARVMEQLAQELADLIKEKENLEQEKEVLTARLKKLQEEYEGFPQDHDTGESYRVLEGLQEKEKIHSHEVDVKNEKVRRLLENLQNIRQRLRSLTEELSVPPRQEDYELVLQRIKSYGHDLQQLELTHKDFINGEKVLRQLQSTLDETRADVDELKGEINILKSELDMDALRLQQVEDRLREMGAEEIQGRIAHLVERLELIPKELRTLEKNMSTMENQIDNRIKELEELGKRLKLSEQFHALWQEILWEELQLSLVPKVVPEEVLQTEQLLKWGKDILQEYGFLLKENTDRDKITQRLNQTFYQEQGVLMEYRLTQESVLEKDTLPLGADDPLMNFKREELKQKSRRVQLLMEYQGKRVSPYYVFEQMNKDIELQQMLLNEKDRELYEEIIMNSVGRIIRGKINRAERWVKKISELMEERDTSSGLTFSLRWKPRTAEHEAEMDTKDLVNLLRLDSRLLKEADLERVTQHFRAKVDQAKEVLEDKGYGETFHQVIKEMLDYRQWFSFTLYYQRAGEQKKELTNNVFYQFSGGEKAMAMYIPLFSAAYSRYLEAREDAPFIISLDEAFAGVDENNIRDMFDLVEKLGFNFIMNSQNLWGDYDTVSSLSICELVRPKNAPYVTVVRYRWDGQKRYLLSQGDFSQGDDNEEREAIIGA
ncbi:TIGR02680 family protein [Dehalobacterium formicoaceticum]|uniref:TIGR02680 family protein n=1 Tax=Dehalobacterium formicoaceticum TaxID=51515 RepID=A0ABT1Y2K3_9FIRM|nr:TIGR02680 family protein [Dehalobacterium formicoaceticum]MCR6545097.1 TIGR02680 family protein [Dehalobacterium formicoaceticum]